jgi:F0F1-type ATP synthase assembly protein I
MVRPASGQHGPSLTTFQALTVASQFGVTLAAAVVLGSVVGQWLDGVLKTSFIFTLIGVFLGFASAVSSTVTLYRVYMRRSEREWRERRAISSRESLEDDQTER